MGNFVERVAAASVGQRLPGEADIRPALTPEMIPEALRAPEERRAPPRPPAVREPRSPKSETELAAKGSTPMRTSPEETVAAHKSAEIQTDRNPPGLKENLGETQPPEREKGGALEPVGPAPATSGFPSPRIQQGSARSEPSHQRSVTSPNGGKVVLPGGQEQGNVDVLPTIEHGPESHAKPFERPRESDVLQDSPPTDEIRATKESREAARGQATNETHSTLVPAKEATPKTAEEPTVTINIGRIEVRAVNPERPPSVEIGPALSLKEYMKQKSDKER